MLLACVGEPAWGAFLGSSVPRLGSLSTQLLSVPSPAARAKCPSSMVQAHHARAEPVLHQFSVRASSWPKASSCYKYRSAVLAIFLPQMCDGFHPTAQPQRLPLCGLAPSLRLRQASSDSPQVAARPLSVFKCLLRGSLGCWLSSGRRPGGAPTRHCASHLPCGVVRPLPSHEGTLLWLFVQPPQPEVRDFW